jgi:hypothetical protein
MSDTKHIQEYLMLSNRLRYGGRKARSANRRLDELAKPLRAFVHEFARQHNTVGAQLLKGVGAVPPSSGDPK